MYELTVGLETHVELATRSKIFCGCAVSFGAPPNTLCCPVCAGLPGALPRLNQKALEYAILSGIALNCHVNSISEFDRKNYVYPDLPKAYQITQQRRPICQGGWLALDSGKRIPILQLHLEEDAGKLLHKGEASYVDYNRAGVPLVEIVCAPTLSSAAEAREYLEKLRLLLKYLEVSDCRMEEGSLRCDINISVHPTGSEALGTRVEIKNMNSPAFIEKAINYEFARQSDLLAHGGQVEPETRRFQEATGQTQRMRGKEEARDYRYFPDPDLPPILVPPERLEALRAQLPELPAKKQTRYTDQLSLPIDDARLLVRYPRAAAFFEAASEGLQPPRTAANLILGQIFARLPTEADKERFRPPITPADLRSLLRMLEQGQLGMSLAKATLERMLDTGKPPEAFLGAKELTPLEEAELSAICAQLVNTHPAAADYRAGKASALKALVGGVMKKTNGVANPLQAEKLLKSLL